jgi:hypothetical protein
MNCCQGGFGKVPSLAGARTLQREMVSEYLRGYFKTTNLSRKMGEIGYFYCFL